MDNTVLGVIIGSGLTFFGSFVNQLFTTINEGKKWERQRQAAKEDKQEESLSKEQEYLRDLYHKCLLSVSVLESIFIKNRYIEAVNFQNPQEEKPLIDPTDSAKELSSYLNLLLLRTKDSRLLRFLETDLTNQDFCSTIDLRNYIIKLIEHESSLFKSTIEMKKEEDTAKNQKQNNTYRIDFSIDRGFRKELTIKTGIELPSSHSINCELTELTNKQREKVYDTYETTGFNIGLPLQIPLTVPVFNEHKKRIDKQGSPWQAKLNPLTTPMKDILDAWMADFDQHYQKAEQALKESEQQSSPS